MTGTSISKVERAVAAAEDDTRTAQIGLRSVRLEVEHLRILPLLAYPFVVVFPPGARAESTPGTENRGAPEGVAGFLPPTSWGVSARVRL